LVAKKEEFSNDGEIVYRGMKEPNEGIFVEELKGFLWLSFRFSTESTSFTTSRSGLRSSLLRVVERSGERLGVVPIFPGTAGSTQAERGKFPVMGPWRHVSVLLGLTLLWL